ncbi:MAG: cation:proton antiporter [Candidatus Obscuribacterales bacterium]|nr:cation:proton antiporter [Candidatus Obscuribacterales bacterium]
MALLLLAFFTSIPQARTDEQYQLKTAEALAQGRTNAKDIFSTSKAPDSAEVIIGGRYRLLLSSTPNFTAQERAEIVGRRIENILNNDQMNPKSITVRISKTGAPSVVLNDFVIVATTANDTLLYGKKQTELAELWSQTLKTQITELQPGYLNSNKVSNLNLLRQNRVLLLILQIAILLFAAFACGQIMIALGQPPVIGQLLAGILLGPSFLGNVAPQIYRLVFPADKVQANLLEAVSWLGVIFLLMLSGMEMNLDFIRRQRAPAFGAAVWGSIFPFMIGAGVGFLLPDSFLVSVDQRSAFALYLGTVFSVSSVPVVAKILMEMKLSKHSVGQITLSAALVHDVFGCILLALVAILADGGHVHTPANLIKVSIGGIIFLTILAASRKVIFALLELIKSKSNDEALLMMVIVLLLFSAAATQYLGLHVVLGSFSMGVLIAQAPAISERIIQPLRVVTMSIFAPIFFAAAGLNLNLSVLSDPQLLLTTILFFIVVCVAKIGSGYLGARWGKLSHWESLAIGIGTNTYGAMGLIFAIIGFSMGLLTINMYSIIVVMAILTTAIAAPLLKWATLKIKETE